MELIINQNEENSSVYLCVGCKFKKTILKNFNSILVILCLTMFYCCQTKTADNKDNNESFNNAKQDEWINKRKGFYIEARVNNWRKEDGFNFLPVTTVLINNTPDTIRYATYSCSWDMNYETDNKLLPLVGIECDHNVPKLITILPYSMDAEKKLEIRTKTDTAQLYGLKFRIGFNYISVKYGEDVDDKTKLLFKHDHLIWSDTLAVK